MLSETHITPAELIVLSLGSRRAVARACHIDPTAVTKWLRPRLKGGTGGRVPLKHILPLVKASIASDNRLNEHDLVYGRLRQDADFLPHFQPE